MDENKSVTYNILMKTPIGIKKGFMTVSQNGSQIRGCLDILNHSEPFEGEIAEDGSCVLLGTIVTLVRTVRYRAKGSITEDGLTLFVADGNDILKITGVPVNNDR